jgi:hypothetical protein
MMVVLGPDDMAYNTYIYATLHAHMHPTIVNLNLKDRKIKSRSSRNTNPAVGYRITIIGPVSLECRQCLGMVATRFNNPSSKVWQGHRRLTEQLYMSNMLFLYHMIQILT